MRELDDLRQFRHDVRSWLEAHVPPGWQASLSGAGRDEWVMFQRSWLQELRAAGLAVPHWPAEWGGGRSLAEQIVIFEELARAGTPRLQLYFVSLHHAAATLIGAGTDEQRQRHLPAILDGEVWCQGFSEPDAGSDLASLRTRAIRDGDRYVVNGQKVWSSLAMHADYCLLLARTDPDAPKRRGISYFILDMRAEGVTVRPIRQATGESEFCELFLTDVEIPVQQRIGDENDGWGVAQRTLSTERGVTILELAERLRVGFALVVELARAAGAEDRADVAQELAGLYADVEVLRLVVNRMLTSLLRGSGVGPEAAIVKLCYSELLQRLTAFCVRIAGLEAHIVLERAPGGAPLSGAWLLDHIGSWAWTIAGGTNEILRTAVAEHVLGLPREGVGSP